MAALRNGYGTNASARQRKRKQNRNVKRALPMAAPALFDGQREHPPLTHAAVLAYTAVNTTHITATAIPGNVTTPDTHPRRRRKNVG